MINKHTHTHAPTQNYHFLYYYLMLYFILYVKFLYYDTIQISLPTSIAQKTKNLGQKTKIKVREFTLTTNYYYYYYFRL